MYYITFDTGGGWVLPNGACGMCRWMGSHFHDWIDYNGVAFSIGASRVTRMGSHIGGISGVSKFWQVHTQQKLTQVPPGL